MSYEYVKNVFPKSVNQGHVKVVEYPTFDYMKNNNPIPLKQQVFYKDYDMSVDYIVAFNEVLFNTNLNKLIVQSKAVTGATVADAIL